MTTKWRNATLADMADPARLLLADKCLRVDTSSRERPDSTLGFSFKNAVPRTLLPVELRPFLGGLGCELPLTVRFLSILTVFRLFSGCFAADVGLLYRWWTTCGTSKQWRAFPSGSGWLIVLRLTAAR